MLFKKIITYLFGIGIVTVMFGVIYGTVQQNYRQSANDPQIELSLDSATFLSSGGDLSVIAANFQHVDFSESLAPFIIVYDDGGAVLLATGEMQGTIPTPPQGVFDFVRSLPAGGEDRLTWQPASNVRVASVITRFNKAGAKGFVLAGRNLREVEVREASLTFMVFVGWAVCVFGIVLLFFLSLIPPHRLHMPPPPHP